MATCPVCSATLEVAGACVMCGWTAPVAPSFVDREKTVGTVFFAKGAGWVVVSLGAEIHRAGGTFRSAVCRVATAEEIATKRAGQATESTVAAEKNAAIVAKMNVEGM